MKRFLACILMISMLASCAFAENLSEMSADELAALRNAINAELARRPEWKQVVIPAGEWIIGEDIPAGYYSISAEKLAITQAAAPGSKFDDFYHVIAAGGFVGKVLFVEGSIFKTNAPVVLAPPVGLEF